MLVDTAAVRFAARVTIVHGRGGRVRITATGGGQKIAALANDSPVVDQQQDSLNGVATLCRVGEVSGLELRSPEKWSFAFDLEVVRFQ